MACAAVRAFAVPRVQDVRTTTSSACVLRTTMQKTTTKICNHRRYRITHLDHHHNFTTTCKTCCSNKQKTTPQYPPPTTNTHPMLRYLCQFKCLDRRIWVVEPLMCLLRLSCRIQLRFPSPPPLYKANQIHRNSPQMPLFHHANAKFSTTTAISSNKNRKQQPPQMKKEKDNRGPIGRLNLNELSDPIVTRDLNKPCCQHCNFCKGCEPCGRWNAADAYSKGQGVIIADASLAKGDPPLSVQAANTMFKINV